MQVAPSQEVRHLSFSSDREVGKAVFGEVYAGTGGEKGWVFMIMVSEGFLPHAEVEKRIELRIFGLYI